MNANPSEYDTQADLDELLAEKLAVEVIEFVRDHTQLDMTAGAEDALTDAVERWTRAHIDECRAKTREGAEPVGGWEEA